MHGYLLLVLELTADPDLLHELEIFLRHYPAIARA